ncbi:MULTISPECIES: DUF3139 domain-containing protein [Bacillus]|uniref:DUF3139 domain-containing protein n=4 Tax=Bacillus thuringiensis TaxID=1428 RepID=A0AB36U3D0_BACTU|nr:MULTISPECIES: DUF3139 domain-containing protein [Bacillus]AEA15596.1 hypothetical protein CT43_CH1912 [Bacillus thuringiensis serovar chinensis CT-43]AFV17719.1 hypothetical protein BTB_c20270 [Bacillus thuringiensis Bt407]ARP57331.1 hypothetical protein CAB88_09610 [Bacillus thuringiensis]EEM29311.1 hypothetical protein bthur0002_18140 [Bacillus thuringiensis Bt407]EEM35675.1 hypothetical protein bthur0003_17780 [Bacillus thuringiensis serovar thuringiensis str. T01001]
MCMKRKKWVLLLTAVGLFIILFALYFIFGNPLNYKVIEKDTSNYLHIKKGYKQEEIQDITGKYTPIYNIGYYATVVYKDEPYFTYSYTYDDNKKIIQDNGILGRHTESFEHLNLNWSLFDQLVDGIHTNLQGRGLREKKDYSIRNVQFIDIDDDKNGAEAYVDFKNDKESDYSYRMNSEGKAYQYNCSNGKCIFKEK